MFKRFFNKNRSKAQSIESNLVHRDLFEELFPLTSENKAKFDNAFNSILGKIFAEEDTEILETYSKNYEFQETQFGKLKFNNMSWDLITATDAKLQYQVDGCDAMIVEVIESGHIMTKEQNFSKMITYRDFMRDQIAQKGGGLIMCEEIFTTIGIDGYESILKVPRKEGMGMDYTYFLNLNNYEEQKLYQFRVMVFERSPTGIRDNVSMHPICEIGGVDLMELMKLYRKDPYDRDYKKGNLMNLSEREEFDEYFPFHPLTIIRNKIRPNILDSVKFE